MAEPAVSAWLPDPALPMCELHRHLDGAIRISTIIDLAQQHGLELPARDVDTLRPFVQIDGQAPGLMAFIARFRYLVEILVDLDACRRVAFESVEDAALEGIDYVELRFSPAFMAERHALDPTAVVEACVDGAQAGARAFRVGVGLVGILSRTYGAEACGRELDALLRHRRDLVAVDLAGDEAGFPAGLFREHFRRVRDADLHVTVHAGEAAGPASVWSAIRELGAERIGHGFRAIEDPELVDYLATQGIGLECCPTSNLHISAVPGYDRHPIRELQAAGVKFCLNTDDPAISGISLTHEYTVAADGLGFGGKILRQAQAAALDMAFLESGQREALVARARARAANAQQPPTAP